MPHHHTRHGVHKEAQEARSGVRPWLFFLVGSVFYFYEFFARVAPGVLKKDIIDVTGSTEGQFGLAMGMYFLAYAPAQLVVGRLLDRFGTRFIIAPAAIIVAAGCLLFASTDSIVAMGIGRFLQGLGSAVAYLGVVYLAMVWFPPHRHGIVPGLTVAMGTLGASTAQYPLTVMADSYGWRAPIYICAIAGLGIAVMLWFLVPRRPSWFIELMREDGYDPDVPVPILTTIVHVAKDRQLWLISLAAAGLYLPISVIGDLWGVTFLQIESGLTIKWASLATTLVFIGFAVGGVGFGHLADRLGRRKILFVGCAIMSTIIASVIMFAGIQPTWLTVALLGVLGFTTGGQALAFVMTADQAARHTRGLKLAFVNFVVMLLPVAVQPGVGFLAGIGVKGDELPTGVQELRGYSLVVALMIVGTVIAFFVRETRPRQDGEPAGH
jgi:MFS family permease